MPAEFSHFHSLKLVSHHLARGLYIEKETDCRYAFVPK
jgi:hypothetical protein